MATITSRGPVLIDYLVTLFTSAATLGAAAPPGTVAIYDGPVTTGLDSPLKLYVGWTDPDDTGAENAYDSNQTWAALGRLARNEDLTIHCCAEAWSGIDDVKTVRTSCTAITSAVEVLMQSDSSQFGGNVLYPNPGITNIAAPQNNTKQGTRVQQTFDLAFMCRIGG
jgi:hypothetical protein